MYRNLWIRVIKRTKTADKPQGAKKDGLVETEMGKKKNG